MVGTTDKATIKNWYADSAYRVEQIKTADGKTLFANQVDSLVSAMAAFAPPAAGMPMLPTDYTVALAPLLATSWRPA